jgi:hypothetical protein
MLDACCQIRERAVFVARKSLDTSTFYSSELPNSETEEACPVSVYKGCRMVQHSLPSARQCRFSDGRVASLSAVHGNHLSFLARALFAFPQTPRLKKKPFQAISHPDIIQSKLEKCFKPVTRLWVN